MFSPICGIRLQLDRDPALRWRRDLPRTRAGRTLPSIDSRHLGRLAENPTLRGRYSEIIPHLTVAQVGDEQLCDRIAVKFTQAAREELPIKARATKVALLVKRGGKWRVHTEFTLY